MESAMVQARKARAVCVNHVALEVSDSPSAHAHLSIEQQHTILAFDRASPECHAPRALHWGQPPINPRSNTPDWQTDATRRFEGDPEAKAALAKTKRIVELDAGDHDAIFFPGGHGPMWDYPGDQTLANLIEAFDEELKPIAAVCHGPAALVAAKRSDGLPLVNGRKVTGFTNGEEAAVELTEVVPFLLEEKLKELGGNDVKGPDFESFVIADGHIVTGQNPASSAAAAEKVLEALGATQVAKSA
jgi:putative intracellular protease/amidase